MKGVAVEPKAAYRKTTDRPRRVPSKIQVVANSYCLRQYAVGYTGGTPRRLHLPTYEVWIVPVLFTSPGYGVVGGVGVLAIDPVTHEIVGSSSRGEVRAAAARLAGGKRDEIDTAFRRASWNVDVP